MREIKFRAWWKDAKLMVNVETLRANESIEFFVPVKSGEKTWKEMQVLDEPEQYELMQFTGLHDKNGKEIYEGDICKMLTEECCYCEDDTFAIVWEEDGYWAPFAEANSVGEIEPSPENCEIIGNIYEHPELLTK